MPKKTTTETGKETGKETVTPRRSERERKPVIPYQIETFATISTPEKSKKETKAATVKKKKTTEKAKGPKKKIVKKKKVSTKTKPTYESMIKKALQQDLDSLHSGISIAKFISLNYPVSTGFKRYMKEALERGVSKGTFIKHRASYRLSAKAKASVRPKRKETTSATKKKEKASTKKTKTSVSKKRQTSKKESTSPKKNARTSSSSSSKKKSSSSRTSSGRKKTSSRDLVAGGMETGVEQEEDPSAPTCYIPGCKYEYGWQYYHDGWRNYDPEASDVVESVYQGYLENRGDTDVRAVRSGSWEYMVDFLAFKQTNIQHENHTVRDIRRIRNTAISSSK